MLKNVLIFSGLAVAAGFYMGGGSESNLTDTRQQAAQVNAERPTSADDSRQISDNIVAFTDKNAGMKAARQKARNTISRFDKMLNAREAGVYSIKFPLTQNGNTEHIWLQVDRMSDSGYVGRLANEPVNGDAYRMGQRMTVQKIKVEDWMVQTDEGIYGAYTARFAISQMPKEKADQLAAQFID